MSYTPSPTLEPYVLHVHLHDFTYVALYNNTQYRTLEPTALYGEAFINNIVKFLTPMEIAVLIAEFIAAIIVVILCAYCCGCCGNRQLNSRKQYEKLDKQKELEPISDIRHCM